MPLSALFASPKEDAIKSAAAVTYEVDDAPEAARQLAAGIGERPGRNAVGILLCDADTDVAALSAEVKRLLNIDVAGMTTLAALSPEGRHETAATLVVLGADDCFFSVSASDSLREGDHARKITDAYRECLAGVEDAAPGPKLIFAFCPFGMPFSGDKYPEILSRAAGDAPIMGGVASDDYDYGRARVFLSGREYRDCLVLVGVWGNARPLFSIRHVTSRFAERIRRVTQAEDNIVRRVGDETFIEYLNGFGLKTDVADPLLAFTSYPMMLHREDSDEIPLMRHIFSLNHADGSGTCFGDVPTGALANICLITRNDLIESCRESLRFLLEEAERVKDYRWSSVFCFSCCGRAVILGTDPGAEGEVLAQRLPPGLTLAGAYCLGEICPARFSDGRASNRFHNGSITFCIL
jgi:hypothetical protein